MTANFAETQMHPGITHLDALLTRVRFWLQVTNLIGVCAGLRHDFPLVLIAALE